MGGYELLLDALLLSLLSQPQLLLRLRPLPAHLSSCAPGIAYQHYPACWLPEYPACLRPRSYRRSPSLLLCIWPGCRGTHHAGPYEWAVAWLWVSIECRWRRQGGCCYPTLPLFSCSSAARAAFLRAKSLHCSPRFSPARYLYRFVTFEHDESAEAALGAGAMHDIGGRRVEVKPATPKGSGAQARGAGPLGGPGAGPGGPGRGRGGYFTGMGTGGYVPPPSGRGMLAGAAPFGAGPLVGSPPYGGAAVGSPTYGGYAVPYGAYGYAPGV